jgi:hypothetical protein
MRQTMNDYDSTEDRELTTEQIANAGTTPDQQDMQDMQDQQDVRDVQDQQAPTGYPGYEDDNAAPVVADYEDDNAAPLAADDEDDNAAPAVADYDNAAPAVADYDAAPAVADYDAAPVVADYPASGQADRTTPDTGSRSTPDTGNGARAAAGPAARARLLDDGELQTLTARWKDIQAEFVEEPTTAVRQADALVAELMQRLAVMFAAERTDLENRWAGDDEVTTEDLRQGLRRYRSFFERLLAA